MEEIKLEETKKEKFDRLAEARVNATLEQIRLLGNLSNTYAYEYSEEDIAEIVKTLRKAITKLDKTLKKGLEDYYLRLAEGKE